MSCENPIHHHCSLLTRNFLLCFINFSLSFCVFFEGGKLQGFKMLQFSGCRSLPNQSPSLAATFSRTRANQPELVHMLSSSGSAQDRPSLATSYVTCSSICLQTHKPLLEALFLMLLISTLNYFLTLSSKKTPALSLIQYILKIFRWMQQVSSIVHFNTSHFSACTFCTRGWSQKTSLAPKQSECHLVSF